MKTQQQTPTAPDLRRTAAWSPEKGWHMVTPAEHRRMQREAVARILRQAPE